MEPQALLNRLDAIGTALAESGNALALIGLGSVGSELDRLDEYSDLDFFAIVEPGAKACYLEQLDWLNVPCPVIYAFRNTQDGYKALYEDGIFAEFAVFEPRELAQIPFARGRLVWSKPGAGINDSICVPQVALSEVEAHSVEWLVGESITNLLVGMGRYRRGEKLSALRFVQEYAVDRIIDLAPQFEQEQAVHADPFASTRRLEARFPQLAQRLPAFMQGYDQTPQSALAILAFLSEHFEVNPQVRQAIEELCRDSV